MSDFIDNNTVSEVSPVEDISPGEDDTRSDESSEQTSEAPTVPVRGELQIIIISPDGTMTYYDEGGNITAEVADTAYSLWLSENGALDKPFANYSVSEALLLFIAIGSIVGLICKVFKRRKL